jgi:hypothetical protein
MSRGALVPALMLLVAGPLGAQTGREHFVQPDTAIDAVHTAQRDAFLELRDSTSTISAAGARLMSDLTSSSSLAWMQARSRAVAQACARSADPLAKARLVTTEASWPLELQQQAQTKLLKAMTSLVGELKTCQTRWKTMSADTSQVTLREDAPYQMKLLQDHLDEFNRTAQTYLQYISITLPPPHPAQS